MLTTVVAVAALVVAGAALALAVLDIRQSGTALGDIRRHRRAHDRHHGAPDPGPDPDPELATLREHLVELTEWATGAEQQIADLTDAADQWLDHHRAPDDQPADDRPDPPPTAHLERHDLPTAAMPQADRPQP